MEVGADVALTALERAGALALEPVTALRRRVERGDFLGAEMIVNAALADTESAPLRPEKERWKHALLRDIAECQRVVEVGSAYGYLRRQSEASSKVSWQGGRDKLKSYDASTS